MRLLSALSLLPLLGACELFSQVADPQVAVVTSDGELRLYLGSDDSVETGWTREVEPSNRASLSRAGETVLVGSGASLHQFAVADGQNVWPAITLPSDVLRVSRSGDDRAFVIGFNEVTGVDSLAGSVLWSRSLLDDLLGVSDNAIAANADSLALGGTPNRLLDTESGIVLDEDDGSGGEVTGIEFLGGQLLVADSEGMRTLDAGDLTTIWTQSIAGGVDRFAVGSATILVSVLGEGLLLLDSSTGAVLATTEAGEVFRDVAASEDGFFAARSDGTLLALDANLSEVWRIEASADFGGLAVAGRNVYYAAGLELEALSADGGDYLWGREFGAGVVGLMPL